MLNLNPPYSFALNRTHKMTHEIFGQVPGSRVSWASEIMFCSGQHGAPTVDAIGHIGRDLKLYGGVDAVAATATPGGIGANLGIDHFPLDLMLNRVVVLDVARQLAGGRPDPLAPGFEITAAHLDATAKAQGVEVRPGDSLLIRTGWGQYFGKDNARYLGEQSPGPGSGRGALDHRSQGEAGRQRHRDVREAAGRLRPRAVQRAHDAARRQRHLHHGERQPGADR